MPAANRNFRHLNREGFWPGFAMVGLEPDPEGVLRLDSLPLLAAGDLDTEALPAPTGLTGVAADSSGAIYAVDRSSGAVVQLGDCLGSGRRETILRSSGDTAGIALAPHRHALFVAERSAGRVRIIDLDSGQTTDSWTGLDQPTALAFDGTGALYVVESGPSRVRKFEPSGIEAPSFSTATAAIPATDIAAATVNGHTTIYILDGAAPLIHPLAGDGSPAGEPFGQTDLQQPLGLAADATRLYVGDNTRRRILAFKRGPGHLFVGEAVGYRGPIAGLSIAPAGGLLVHTGSNATIVRLERNAGRRANGLLWSNAPIRAGARKRLWSRLKALALTDGGSLQFFWAFGLNAPTVALDSADPFPASHWLAGSPSVLDFHLGEVEDERLWLAARFSSDGRADPSLEQVRIEFDREGYIQNLPAIFREDPSSDLLSRFLTLFETFFEQGQEGIRRLPELFDPYAVPAEALDWLASWLAVELDEDLSDAKRRETVATAYERYARRGTPRGLREELWRQGIRAHIAEPLQSAQVWTLPRDPDPCACGGDSGCDCDCDCASAGASLGWTTMLAPAEWQGAVAGVSATLDQSHLIPGEEIGSPLWRDFAHRFTVYLYRGASDCPGRRAEIEIVIAREKPAHTLHRVCAIEPRMRVGFQAVVGFDAVVAGQSPSRLDSGESNWILGGPPPGRVGASRVGMAARL